MGVFIEISDSVVPVVQQTAQTFVPQAWVPQGAAAVVPSPTGVTVSPVADGVIVSWVPGADGLATIVETGPASSGPWTVAARSGDTTVTIGLTAAAYVRAMHETNGIQSAPTAAILATPVDVSKIMQDASNALAAADGDVTFTKSATQPLGASYGDIWQDSDDGAIYRWLDVDGNGSFQWEPRPNDALALAIIAAAGAQGTADGKVRLVVSESAPTGWVAGDAGDQWYKASTKQLSIWSGSAFLSVQDYDAQAKLADIVSDNIISRAEKLSEVINWNEAVNALSSDQSKASAAGVSHADYTAAYTALESYISGLSPALTDRTADTPVAGATYVSLWNTYRAQRTLLLNAIADKARTTSTWSGVSGTGKPQDNADVTATAPAFTAVNVRMPGGTDVLVTANAAAADATAKANAAAAAAAADATAKANAALATAHAAIDAVNAKADTAMAKIADIANAPAHSTANTYLEDALVKSGSQMYRAKQAVPVGVAISNTTYWEYVGEYDSIGEALAASIAKGNTNATAISAEVTRLNGLLARVPATGDLVNQAALLEEQTARVDAVSSLASRSSTLEATVNSGTDGNAALKARIASEETTRASQHDAQATQISGIIATNNDQQNQINSKASITQLNDAIAGEAGARATAISNVQADYNGKLANKASVTQLNEAIAGEQGTRASSIAAIQGQLDNPSTGLSAVGSIANQAVVDIRNNAKANPNILLNPTFADGLATWANWNTANLYSSATWGAMVALPPSKNGLPTGNVENRNAVHKVIEVAVESWRPYTISADCFYAEPAGNGSNVWIAVERLHNDLSYTSGTGSSASVSFTGSPTGTITRKSVTIDASADAGGNRLRIYLVADSTENTNYFRRIKVEGGTVATPFSDEATLTSTVSQTNALNAAINDPVTGLAKSHARITAEETARANADSALSSRTSTLEGSVNNPTTGIAAVGSVVNQAVIDIQSRGAQIDANVSQTNALNLAVGGVNGSAVSGTSLTYRANQLEATKVEFLKVGDKVAGWRAAATDAFSSFQMQFDAIDLLTGASTGVSITKNKMDRVFGNAAFYEGDPFGSDSLVFWIGPKSIAKSGATKANGTFWVSSTGANGGGAMIGKFGTSRASATSSTPNGTVEVSTGNFERSSSNAQITVSVGMATFRTSSGSGTNSTTAQSASGVIEKSVDGGAWTQVGGWSARGSYNVEYDSGIKSEVSEVSGGGYAADTTSGTNIAYRARRTGGIVNLVSGVANNMTISITVEQV